KKLNLEHEKLKIELEKLRVETQKKTKVIVEPSPEQINKYVLEPLAEEIKNAAREMSGAADSLRVSQYESYNLSREFMGKLATSPSESRREFEETRERLEEIVHYLRQLVAMTETTAV